MRLTIDRLVGAIEPDRVEQIGRADLAIALAVNPMASRAILIEELFALRLGRDRVGQIRHGAHIIRHVGDLLWRQNAVAPKSRHGRNTGLLIGVPTHAVLDGGLDVGELAAPDPGVGVEIGISLRPLRAGAVAGGAIVEEGHPADSARRGEQFRILLDGIQRRVLDLGEDRRAGRLQIGDILDHRRARVPSENALGRAMQQRPGRINNAIGERPNHGRDEGPHPPARQRRVEFLYAVPFMPGRGRAAMLVDANFAVVQIVHGHSQSSRSGILPASSKYSRREGRNT